MKLWLSVFAAIVLAAYIIVANTLMGKAHESVTGWQYPSHCCGDGDCAHALSAIRHDDGSLTVTTKHGTATFPANFKYDPSPDGLVHACFTRSRLYCLYLATGI